MNLMNDVPENEFVKDIMSFIQYLCENCQLEFQNFLRQQIYNNNNSHSTNLVGEICKFSIVLFEDQYTKEEDEGADNFYKIYIKVKDVTNPSARNNINFNLLL